MSPPIRDGSGNSIGSIRLGDGSEIAEVRTGAGDVLFSAGPPDSAIDTYEPHLYEDLGNSLSDYYSSDLANYNRQTNAVLDGQQTLKSDGSGNIDLVSNAGLPRYPEQGDVVELLIQSSSSGRCLFGTFASGIGVNKGAANNAYEIVLNAGSGWSLVERSNGSTVTGSTGSTTGTSSIDTTYLATITFDGSTVDATATRVSDSTQVFSDSITPSSDLSGTDGIHIGQLEGGVTFYDSIAIQ